jgi:tetratricopeptide (TPR) repeat protein
MRHHTSNTSGRLAGISTCLAGGANFLILVMCGWLVVSGATTSAAQTQTGQNARSFESSMHQHYDAAYRYQSAGDLAQAGYEYKLFLADALHQLGNGRANIGEYNRALPLYEDAIGLAPDFILYLDYASAELDGGDASKAIDLAQNALGLNSNSARAQELASAHMVIGQALRKKAVYGETVEQFKVAVATDPSFDNMYTLGVAYLALPDVADTKNEFAALVARFGSPAATHMKFGIAYGEAGYPDEAIEEFKTAIARDDRLPGAHYSLGASYINKFEDKGFALAEPELRKELTIQPNDPLTYPLLGRIMTSQHKYHEAEIDLQLATVLNPKNADNFFDLGELYVAMQRPLDAEKALRKAIEETPDPALDHYAIQHAHYRLGRLLVEAGQVEEGKKELDIAQDLLLRSRLQDEAKMAGKPAISAILTMTHPATAKEVAAEKAFEKQIGPLMAGCYSNLGGIADLDKNFAQAANNYEHAYRWNPDIKGLNENWGRAAFAAQEYSQALGPLSRAFETHPEDVQLRAMLGVSQYEPHDYTRSLETLQPIENSLHGIPQLAYDYAESLMKTGNARDGAKWLEALAQGYPGNAVYHRALGEAYAMSGDHAGAEKELRAANKLDPVDAETKSLLASNLIAQGQKAEAEALLSELTNTEHPAAEIYYRLAQLQRDRGDDKDAVSNLEAAAKLSPQDETILQTLLEAYRKNGQPQQAEREQERLEILQSAMNRQRNFGVTKQ